MNEQKCIHGTSSLSWKEVGRTVSTEKSHCPVRPTTGTLCNPGLHLAGIQQGSWVGVGAQHCLPPNPTASHTQNSICFLLLIPAMGSNVHRIQNVVGAQSVGSGLAFCPPAAPLRAQPAGGQQGTVVSAPAFSGVFAFLVPGS